MARKKRRGAQPSNVNALKSGFYSRTFSEAELVEIGRLAVAEHGLDEEIAMPRVLMRRVLESEMPAAEAVDLFGRASGQLRRLVVTRADLENRGDSEESVEAAAQRTGNPGAVTDFPRRRVLFVPLPDSTLECSAATKREGSCPPQPPSCARYVDSLLH